MGEGRGKKNHKL